MVVVMVTMMVMMMMTMMMIIDQGMADRRPRKIATLSDWYSIRP